MDEYVGLSYNGYKKRCLRKQDLQCLVKESTLRQRVQGGDLSMLPFGALI